MPLPIIATGSTGQAQFDGISYFATSPYINWYVYDSNGQNVGYYTPYSPNSTNGWNVTISGSITVPVNANPGQYIAQYWNYPWVNIDGHPWNETYNYSFQVVSSSSGSSSSTNSSSGSSSSSNTSSLSSTSSQSSSSSESSSSSSQSSETSSSSSSSEDCWPLPLPVVSQNDFSSFVVTAPSDVPPGVILQLQVKLDGEPDWNDVGMPVGAGGVVTVDQLDPCSGYWVRWTQIG